MAWGDVLGALGAGMAGVSHAYEGEMAQRDKERLQQLHDETLQMIAQIGAKKATDVEEIRSEAKRQHDKALQVMNELTNSTKVTVAKDNNDKKAQIAQWYNDRHINETEMILLNRLSLAEYNANAAGERNERTAQATEYAADTAAQSRRDVAGINQTGQTQRQRERMPLDIYKAEGRYKYGAPGARRGSSRRNQGPTTPSFSQWQGGKMDSGDFNLDLATARSGGAAPQTGTGAGPYAPPPNLMETPDFSSFDVSPMFQPSSAMPSMGPAPAPAAPATPPGVNPSLGDVGTFPPSAFGPGLTGGRTFYEAALPAAASSPAPAPAATAQPPTSMTDAQKKARVSELQKRYEDARANGRFQEMRSIEQLIRDAIQ